MLQPQTRADLFRLLGDEDRLRLYALCAEDELTISELAELLHESQPQVSRKLQPLRAAGLLAARKDGTRTYLKAAAGDGADVEDAIVLAALEEGRRLCRKDKSLARVPRILREREEGSRAFFDALPPTATTTTAAPAALALLGFLPLLRPLLGEAALGLCVDVGAGDGVLLPLLSPLFSRVFAVDRSPARLAACSRVVAEAGLGNVRLLEGDAGDALVHEAVTRQGGAAVVVVARTLHHAARPAELLAACARLLRPGGVVVVVDYLPHDDESMREQGDVWLGFAPDKLAAHLKDAGLQPSSSSSPFPAPAGLPDSHLSWQWIAATVNVQPALGLSEIH
ncbi:MAG: metalloregulator ArsR/SmtB family transcription factor [Deltaproteobacteria bacterium]|nr:metalloregulator ArsR/SmtB family transcription factor [Deltaproteobacteria bacterium]